MYGSRLLASPARKPQKILRKFRRYHTPTVARVRAASEDWLIGLGLGAGLGLRSGLAIFVSYTAVLLNKF